MLKEPALVSLSVVELRELIREELEFYFGRLNSENESSPADRRRRAFEERAKQLCRELKAAGDDSLDTPRKLKNFVNERFETGDGLNSLGFESFEVLIAELKTRLEKATEKKQPKY